MTAYRVFTVRSGSVEDGANVEAFKLKGAGIEIPAILVGEEGRGRELGVLPVAGVEVGGRVSAASIGQTKSGKPKLHYADSPTTDEAAIVVLKTRIGFRGSNSHTGDRSGWRCEGIEYQYCDAQGGEVEPPASCPKCGRAVRISYLPFPGERIVQGVIAQGAAGRMGSGTQMVAIIPKGVVFRTGYSGRLYGGPTAHYYLFDGSRILSATWEDRQFGEVF